MRRPSEVGCKAYGGGAVEGVFCDRCAKRELTGGRGVGGEDGGEVYCGEERSSSGETNIESLETDLPKSTNLIVSLDQVTCMLSKDKSP